MSEQDSVTAQYLLEGAYYALEQCGILLYDALVLCKNESYSSATVLAVFAREALGQTHILRELRKKVMAGTKVTIKDIWKQCKSRESHIKKLERSQFSASMHAPHDSERGKLMLAMSHNPPRSLDELFEQLSSIAGQVKERTPLEERRHRLRMSLLYVDPSKSGKYWIRPRLMSLVGTQRFINQALLDYFYYYDRIERVYPDEGDGFFNEIRRWDGRPQLHSPVELSNQLFG